MFDGIVGVEGTIPFGAIVSLGHKGERGAPANTDRFYISSTGFEEINGKGGGYRNLRHPLDPRFAAFNGLKDKKKAATLRGNLMFPNRADCMNHHLVAQQLGRGRTPSPPGGGVWATPPRAMPACTGDGKTARRFNGMSNNDEPEFIEIACPNRLCVFRTGQQKICGAMGRLYFRLRWAQGTQDALTQKTGEGLPEILVRYQTHAWNTVENLVGMFDAVEQTAEGLGMPRDSWTFAGLPFEMTVGMKKIPDKGRSFPVVSFALEDVIKFLSWQVEKRQFLLAAPRSVALLGDGMQRHEGTDEAIGEALDHITPGHSIPASLAAPQAEPEVIEPEVIEEPAEPSPEVQAYRVDPNDPRSPVDRLRDHAIDALGLALGDLHQAARKAAGCPPEGVSEMFESAVADELEKMARSK